MRLTRPLRPKTNRYAIPVPEMTPCSLEQPTRHLIYHIYPHQRSNIWKWNIQQLLRRISLFDGVRSIGVVTDHETASLTDVQMEFNGARVDNWFETPNHPLVGLPGNVMSDDGASALLGEGLSFVPLLHTLPRTGDHVTFYGHARGSRYSEGDGHFERHKRWTNMLYHSTLDDWPKVLQALREFPMAGAFKRYGDFRLPRNAAWHYSGTFFWFRNADVFASRDWPRLHPAMYGQVEAWAAGLFKASETACLFGDNAGFLYQEEEIQRWEAQLP